MVQRFLDAVEEFNNGRLTLLDLSASARHTAVTLDNASAPLPRLFEKASSDLEYAHFATQAHDHGEAGRRILGPILARIAEDA
jgi:hypothetical protein